MLLLIIIFFLLLLLLSFIINLLRIVFFIIYRLIISVISTLRFFFNNWKKIILILFLSIITFPFSLIFLTTFSVISIIKIFSKEWRIKLLFSFIMGMIPILVKYCMTILFDIELSDFRINPFLGIPTIAFMMYIKEKVKSYVQDLEKDNLSSYPHPNIILIILVLLTPIILISLWKIMKFYNILSDIINIISYYNIAFKIYIFNVCLVYLVFVCKYLLDIYPPILLWVFIPNYLIFVLFCLLFFPGH